LFQATVPGGGYLIPTPQVVVSGVSQPNVTLVGTSMLVGDQASASVDYDLSKRDRLSFKYYYQNDRFRGRSACSRGHSVSRATRITERRWVLWTTRSRSGRG